MDLGAIVGVNADFAVDDVDYALNDHTQVLWSQKGSPFSNTEIMQAFAQGQNADWYGEMKKFVCDMRTTYVV